jgi:SAM-dependent methyltransferase
MNARYPFSNYAAALRTTYNTITVSWEPGHYIWRNRKYIYPSNWRAGAKALYRRWSGSGILFSDEDLGMSSMHPAKKINCILELVKPRSVLDVGCGTGQARMDFSQRGLDALGVEGSRRAITRAPCSELIRQHDLRHPLHLHRCFDRFWCFEVAEHIHPRYVDVFVGSLVRHSPVIAMSAAPPGQGGEGHFNEQAQHYWEKRFSGRGY